METQTGSRHIGICVATELILEYAHAPVCSSDHACIYVASEIIDTSCKMRHILICVRIVL